MFTTSSSLLVSRRSIRLPLLCQSGQEVVIGVLQEPPGLLMSSSVVPPADKGVAEGLLSYITYIHIFQDYKSSTRCILQTVWTSCIIHICEIQMLIKFVSETYFQRRHGFMEQKPRNSKYPLNLVWSYSIKKVFLLFSHASWMRCWQIFSDRFVTTWTRKHIWNHNTFYATEAQGTLPLTISQAWQQAMLSYPFT